MVTKKFKVWRVLMLINQEKVKKYLRCPRTGQTLNQISPSKIVSSSGDGNEYSIVDGQPILVDYTESVLDENNTISSVSRTNHKGLIKILKKIISPSKKITSNNVKKITSLLKKNKETKEIMVLIIGGGSIGQGMMPIYNDPNLHIISFDIYKSEFTQFVADAHQIPLTNDTFDCVIIQAVLEHVLMPQIVVKEITRVLKPRGIVYSETPFLQQVHEGAYDFTRFTGSGHRYLFRNFEEICSGISAGAGTQMLWSIDYFFRSLFRSRKIGKIFKILFFWIQYLDSFMSENYSLDSASGTFFMGRMSNHTVSAKEIIRHYKGAQ